MYQEYPYSGETIEVLDRVLKEVSKNNPSIPLALLWNVSKLPKANLNYRSNILDILNDRDLIETYENLDDLSLVSIRIEGNDFLKSGGFAGEKKRYDKEQSILSEERELLKKLKELQVEDLEKRLVDLENQLKAQKKFWTTSAKKNLEEIPLIKDRMFYIYFTIGAIILRLLFDYFL